MKEQILEQTSATLLQMSHSEYGSCLGHVYANAVLLDSSCPPCKKLNLATLFSNPATSTSPSPSPLELRQKKKRSCPAEQLSRSPHLPSARVPHSPLTLKSPLCSSPAKINAPQRSSTDLRKNWTQCLWPPLTMKSGRTPVMTLSLCRLSRVMMHGLMWTH